MSCSRDVWFESPSELLTGEGGPPPKESKPQNVAAGIPAVLSSIAYVARESGLVRGTRGLLKLNQKEGVDCPSCAWPDPEHRSLFEFCENGAKALADETTTKRVEPGFFAQHSVEEISRLSDFKINGLGRVSCPMHLPPGESYYRPIAWADAFQLVATGLRALSSPHQAAFYTSGRCSNEAAFLYGTMVRMFGTNNLPDCSNMCHESSGAALAATIGISKGTVTLEDFSRTELVVVMGQNPGTNHPRMLTALEGAKKNGARIISINPLAETGLTRFRNPQDFLNPLLAVSTALGSGTPLADMHVPVRIGGDLGLLKGVAKTLLEWADQGRPTLDTAFMEAKTEGFDAAAEDLRAQGWTEIVEAAGVSRESITEVASWMAQTQKIIVCWAMGITQHLHSVPTITQIVNLLLMRGSIGKPGAGACPVRGHSNVQGDRTMGITCRPGPEFLQRLGQEFGFEPPAEAGLDTVDSIEAMLDNRGVKVLVTLGGNFLSASPDTARVAQALQRCSLTVGITTKLNRTHLVTGREALLLPCLGRTEVDLQNSGPQFVSCENSMGKVQRSRGFLAPASGWLLSEVAIVTGIAEALKLTSVPWKELREDYDLIRARIERVVPGFEGYNGRIREPAGFYLPNGPREGVFPTQSGKAKFSMSSIPKEEKAADELFLMTIRSHDQFNTTIYGYGDRYRGIKNSRRVIFVNPDDLSRLKLQAGQTVDIISKYDGVERRVGNFTALSYPIPKDCAAAYFPEANPLVPASHRDPLSGCPASKKIAVRLQAVEAPASVS